MINRLRWVLSISLIVLIGEGFAATAAALSPFDKPASTQSSTGKTKPAATHPNSTSTTSSPTAPAPSRVDPGSATAPAPSHTGTTDPNAGSAIPTGPGLGSGFDPNAGSTIPTSSTPDPNNPTPNPTSPTDPNSSNPNTNPSDPSSPGTSTPTNPGSGSTGSNTPTPDPLNPTPTPTPDPFSAQMTSLLEQIRDIIQTISNYLGINISNSTALPNTPSTPNLNQSQSLQIALANQYQGKNLLFVDAPFNSAVDQSPQQSQPAMSLNQRTLQNGLTTFDPSITMGYMAELGITSLPSGSETTFPGGTPATPQYNNNNDALNFDSLIGPMNYQTSGDNDSNVENLAINFIRYISEQANPIALVDPKMLADTSAEKRNSYLIALRQYLALRSVGTSNLYQMLAKRRIVKDLGKQAGLVDNQGNPIDDASPLQIEEYIASRRALTPQWYQSMEKASPITVARETLYVLAEIQNSLNENRKINERILATLSALQFQSLQGPRTNIEFMKQSMAPPPQASSLPNVPSDIQLPSGGQ